MFTDLRVNKQIFHQLVDNVHICHLNVQHIFKFGEILFPSEREKSVYKQRAVRTHYTVIDPSAVRRTFYSRIRWHHYRPATAWLPSNPRAPQHRTQQIRSLSVSRQIGWQAGLARCANLDRSIFSLECHWKKIQWHFLEISLRLIQVKLIYSSSWFEFDQYFHLM